MTEETKYEWRDRKIGGVSAQAAGEALERIAARDGCIKPQSVVDEARPEDSPIHPAFEWRDKVAAEEHRKWQARQIVRSVRVVTQADNGSKETTPAYIHVQPTTKSSNDGGYHATAKVMSDFDLFERAIGEAHQKLISAERSVSELKRLAEKTDQRDKLSAIGIIAASLQTAAKALSAIH